jgi:hypothetical protein
VFLAIQPFKDSYSFLLATEKEIPKMPHVIFWPDSSVPPLDKPLVHHLNLLCGIIILL